MKINIFQERNWKSVAIQLRGVADLIRGFAAHSLDTSYLHGECAEKNERDKIIKWMQQNSGYDLYYARIAAAQLGISVRFFT